MKLVGVCAGLWRENVRVKIPGGRRQEPRMTVALYLVTSKYLVATDLFPS